MATIPITSIHMVKRFLLPVLLRLLVLPLASPTTATPLAGLTLYLYNNTVLAGPPARTATLPSTSFLLPALPGGGPRGAPFSAEVIGTWTPPPLPPLQAPSAPLRQQQGGHWVCAFGSGIDFAFVTVGGHAVCNNSAAYNNSAMALMDNVAFRPHGPSPNATLPHRLRRRDLVVRMQLYRTSNAATRGAGSVGIADVDPVNAVDVSVSITWCPGAPSAPSSSTVSSTPTTPSCAPLPVAQLSTGLPDEEQSRRQLQREGSAGWGSWLHRDILSVVLLPDSAVVTVMICRISTGICLQNAQIDANGGSAGKAGPTGDVYNARAQHQFVRVGRHAMDHGYVEGMRKEGCINLY